MTTLPAAPLHGRRRSNYLGWQIPGVSSRHDLHDEEFHTLSPYERIPILPFLTWRVQGTCKRAARYFNQQRGCGMQYMKWLYKKHVKLCAPLEAGFCNANLTGFSFSPWDARESYPGATLATPQLQIRPRPLVQARTCRVRMENISTLQEVDLTEPASVPLALDADLPAFSPSRLEAQAPTHCQVLRGHLEAPPQCRALHDQQNAEGHSKISEDPLESPLCSIICIGLLRLHPLCALQKGQQGHHQSLLAESAERNGVDALSVLLGLLLVGRLLLQSNAQLPPEHIEPFHCQSLRPEVRSVVLAWHCMQAE